MKICLDVRFRTESGVSSYITNLVPWILRLGSRDEYWVLKSRHQSFQFEKAAAGVLQSPGRANAREVAWTSTVLPAHLRRGAFDVYHGMKLPGPSWTRARTVSTMHSVYAGPSPDDLGSRLFLRFYGNPMIRRSHRIVAVSDFVGDFLTDRYGVDPDRIDVIYNGIDPVFRLHDPGDVKDLKSRRGLPARYVVCVGNMTPIKNHVTAVRAFARSELPDDVGLVIAGGTDYDYGRAVLSEAERLGVLPRLHLPGFLPRGELSLVMNGAMMMLFPSLIEGFGLAVLEAFATGLPTIASKRGGLRDLGRDVALFVEDPQDQDSFARRVNRLWQDPALRESLRLKGIQAAERYSWRQAALAHIDCYRRAAEDVDVAASGQGGSGGIERVPAATVSSHGADPCQQIHHSVLTWRDAAGSTAYVRGLARFVVRPAMGGRTGRSCGRR